jgi:hypothetical protein
LSGNSLGVETMNKMEVFACLSLGLAVAGCASMGGDAKGAHAKAAPPSVCAGDWKFELDTPMGHQSLPAKLTQNGEEVTGTAVSPLGAEGPVSGTCKANVLTLAQKLQSPMGEIQLDWTGTVTGNTISGNVKFGDMGNGAFTGSKP